MYQTLFCIINNLNIFVYLPVGYYHHKDFFRSPYTLRSDYPYLCNHVFFLVTSASLINSLNLKCVVTLSYSAADVATLISKSLVS